LVTKALALVVVAAVVGTSIGVAGLFGPSQVEATSHSASRSLSADTVAPGGEVEVEVNVSGLGAFGGVEETLPEGFAFVESSLEDTAVTVDGQTVTFAVLGDGDTFTYTVSAAETDGTYTFTGVTSDSNRESHDVVGDADIRVGSSAVRNIAIEAVEVGTAVEVTISVSGLGEFGGVSETLPEGFTYVESSLEDAAVSVDGQVVTFVIIGDATTFTYTASAPNVAGTFAIEGVVTNSRGGDAAVEGESSVTVALEERILPVVDPPDLPPTGDVSVPGWLIAIGGLMGALMVAGGATVALRAGRSSA
jgi:hypothetical protein